MHALIVIDMQRWMFRTPIRQQQLPRLCDAIGQLAEAFETRSLPIFDVRVEHKPDRSTWSRLMLKYDHACLIEGTSDAEAVEGYRPPQSAHLVIKRANSAFLGTDLDEHLRATGVRHLVLCGVFVDGCVGLTAADAAQRNYDLTLVTDAVGYTGNADHAAITEWLVNEYEIAHLPSSAAVASLPM